MNRKFNKRVALLVILAALIVSFSAVYAQDSFKVKLSKDILWVKNSKEYKMCAYQAYTNAMNRLKELAKNEKPGTWCVVLDADETVISNLPFQEDLIRMGKSYNGKDWTAWGMKGKATAVPGAVEFCALAKKLGGKVVIITNRKAPLRQPTYKNLKDLGVEFDVLLLREGSYKKDRNKVMRRTDVEKGTIKDFAEYKDVPPLKILMLAGDQSHDLYDSKNHKYSEIKDRFTKDFIIIPNPMYGSWEFAPGGKVETIGSPDSVPVEVKVGEEFNIILNANPTTGYTWSIARPLDKEVIASAGHDYKIAEPGKLGSGGKSVFTFKAVGKGKALIHLQYKRNWEKGKKPAEKRTYVVIVK